MIMTRSRAVTAAVAAAAALTATGITYAAASPAPQIQAVPAAVQAAPAVPMGGDTGGNASKGNEGKGNEGNNHEGNDHEGGNNHGRRNFEEGWIHINERSYNARPGGCITVVSGLGSKSLNIRNDSRKTVEVFRGVTCDNGAP
ncbi:hypothetical protein, partial [Streptomyces sp. NPDC056160]|uniref:hypothetical protein n=1 Tax=Streptomyces sp. NPDC056160 TaxID=3345731 RepID=UPI0035DEEAEF